MQAGNEVGSHGEQTSGVEVAGACVPEQEWREVGEMNELNFPQEQVDVPPGRPVQKGGACDVRNGGQPRWWAAKRESWCAGSRGSACPSGEIRFAHLVTLRTSAELDEILDRAGVGLREWRTSFFQRHFLRAFQRSEHLQKLKTSVP